MVGTQVFISHASEDKDEIARPLAIKLRESKFDIWYDEFEIIWGDSIVDKINEGLARSSIGVVIFGPTFLTKKWTNAELRTLISFMVNQKIRLLPLLHKISLKDVVDKYPLLADIYFITSDMGLDYVVEQIKKNVQRLEGIKETTESKIAPTSEEHQEIEVQDEKMSRLEKDITSPSTPEIKIASLKELCLISQKESVWKNSRTWKIIDFLLSSQKQNDIRDALDTILNIIKWSNNLDQAERDELRVKISELYFNKLVNFILTPHFSDRILGDSWKILKQLLNSDDLYEIGINALRHGMITITAESSYFNYIQKIIPILDLGNSDQFKRVCDEMYLLMKHADEIIRKRASNIYEYYLPKSN